MYKHPSKRDLVSCCTVNKERPILLGLAATAVFVSGVWRNRATRYKPAAYQREYPRPIWCFWPPCASTCFTRNVGLGSLFVARRDGEKGRRDRKVVLVDRDIEVAVRRTADLPDAARELVVHEKVTYTKINLLLRVRKVIPSECGQNASTSLDV